MSLQKHPAAVRRFARLARFGNWLQNLPNRITLPPFRLMQISSAFWQSRVLYTAARLDIATLLGNATLTAEEIAERTGTQPDPIYRLMRMLVAMGVFEETSSHHFRNNRLSNELRGDRPNNVRAMILLHNCPEMARPWFETFDSGMRDNKPPFQQLHGETLFDYLDHHAELNTLFNQAMDSVESLVGDSYARDVDWGQFERVIDVGGSNGAKVIAILREHPNLNALVVDRAAVIKEAKAKWKGSLPDTIQRRLSFETADARLEVPKAIGPGDIYLLSAVLHGFNDTDCRRILRTLADAIGASGARIAILELILPDQGADLASTSFDLQMFMGTQGRERTDGEWLTLVAECGLEREEVVSLRSFGQLQILRRASLANTSRAT